MPSCPKHKYHAAYVEMIVCIVLTYLEWLFLILRGSPIPQWLYVGVGVSDFSSLPNGFGIIGDFPKRSLDTPRHTPSFCSFNASIGNQNCNDFYFSEVKKKERLKPYSRYSIHLWPSTILNLKDRQLIRGDPRPPVHANDRPIPWTHTFSLCNLSAERSDDVHFRQNCSLLPCHVASFSIFPVFILLLF